MAVATTVLDDVNFTYKVVNNSLMFYGYSAGINLVRWVTRGDERVCPICGSYAGRVYRKGQFLPPLPAHAGCRCVWELIIRREEEIQFEAVDPHEMGHNVYHNAMQEGAKNEWDTIFYPSLKRYELPSDYAERNA